MFSYKFPAVKGIQAGSEYYICMIPLGVLGKIFPADYNDVGPEYRAQRRLNEARIPEIRDYILENRDSYVFSALAASVDGEMIFIPYDDSTVGVLEISLDLLTRNEEDLEGTLTQAQIELFQKYKDCAAELNDINEVTAFALGFKIGMSLTVETMLNISSITEPQMA